MVGGEHAYVPDRVCVWRGDQPRHDRASELDSWDCVDELVAEEDYSQEWGEAASR